jgi:hypothetical protein
VSEYRECDHVAPVLGKPTVFASIEYPVGEEPCVIEIQGIRWLRSDLFAPGELGRAYKRAGDGE